MRWLLFAVVLLASSAAFVLGLWLGKKSKRAALTTVAVGLAFVLVRGLFRLVPALEFTLFPFDAYAVIRPWWAIPPGMAILGAGAMRMSTPGARKGLVVLAVALLLASAQRLWITARFDPQTLTGTIDASGTCPQTTDYTCGAAAAATLLHLHGVQASERELAELCWTNALTGTDEFCVARGLRIKLANTGRTVRVQTGGWEALASRTEPSVVTIKLTWMVDHWVTVKRVDGERVLVSDPLHGVQAYTKAQFLDLWRGVIVSADRAEAR